jgi:hypothetical protein
MNFANPQEHVPEAEQNNQVIKKQIQASYYQLPFKHLTKTHNNNSFGNGIGKETHLLSGQPRYIQVQPKNNSSSKDSKLFKKLQILETMFKDMMNLNLKNNNTARTLDGFYLQFKNNHQKEHKLFHLPTNCIVVHRHVTFIPITTSVIKQVSLCANSEDMLFGLKINSKTDKIIYNVTLITRVDYPLDKVNNDNNNVESQEYNKMYPDKIAELVQQINNINPINKIDKIK